MRYEVLFRPSLVSQILLETLLFATIFNRPRLYKDIDVMLNSIGLKKWINLEEHSYDLNSLDICRCLLCRS